MSDNERRLWVLNDEPLYRAWRASKLALGQYLRVNRAEIDRVIAWRLTGHAWGWPD